MFCELMKLRGLPVERFPRWETPPFTDKDKTDLKEGLSERRLHALIAGSRSMGVDEPLTLEIGKKLSPAKRQLLPTQIKQRMYARWNEKIFGGAFMRDLEAGKLPLETIKLFWRNWYSYPVEVNNFHLIIYQRHQGIFARHRDLLAPYVGKISDELVNPSIPGHIQVLINKAKRSASRSMK